MRTKLGRAAAALIALTICWSCGETSGPRTDSNTNWVECEVDADCDPGYRCSARGVCISERSLAEGSVFGREAGTGRAAADGAPAAPSRGVADGSIPDPRDASSEPGQMGDADAGNAVEASAPGDGSRADAAPEPSCAPVSPGICLSCDGIAVRTDTGQCGCICGEPAPLFEDGEQCVAACPRTCIEATATLLGTASAEGFGGPLPLPDGGVPESCRVSAGPNATVYRTQSCLDERFGGSAPWSVSFGVSQIVEICDPFGGCEWPITLDTLRNCGVSFQADFVVTEPCVTCDAESPRCVFFEMPISPLPIDARPTLVLENCTQSLCEGTGGTWMGTSCDCGPGRSFDFATGCS